MRTSESVAIEPPATSAGPALTAAMAAKGLRPSRVAGAQAPGRGTGDHSKEAARHSAGLHRVSREGQAQLSSARLSGVAFSPGDSWWA